MARCSLLLLALSLASCTVAGEDAYDPVVCRTDNPCYVLDERLCACCPGGPESCEAELAQSCASGELVLTPPEQCQVALDDLPTGGGCPIEASTAALALICPQLANGAVTEDATTEADTADAGPADAGPADAGDAAPADATP
jgi:hypothetical protein